MATSNGSGKTPGSLPPSLAQQQNVARPAFNQAASPAPASTSKSTGTVAGSTGQQKLDNLRSSKSASTSAPALNKASGAAKVPVKATPAFNKTSGAQQPPPPKLTPTFNKASGAVRKPVSGAPPALKHPPPASAKNMPTPGGMGQTTSAARVVLPATPPKKVKPIVATPAAPAVPPAAKRTSAHPMQPKNPVPQVKSDFAKAVAKKPSASTSPSQGKNLGKRRGR